MYKLRNPQPPDYRFLGRATLPTNAPGYLKGGLVDRNRQVAVHIVRCEAVDMIDVA